MDSHEIQMLTERAKELECVYAVDEVLQSRELALPEIMNKLIQIIPGGFMNPEASCIRIILWEDVYQASGFKESDILYSVPILIDGEPIGKLDAGYAIKRLEESCSFLDYEIKLLNTISSRISQLALTREQELSLMLNMLMQIDPDMLLRIGEQMQVYIEQHVGNKAKELFKDLGVSSDFFYGETNAPTVVGKTINTKILAKKLVEGATSFLSQDTVLRLLGGWIQEQRLLAFVKTAGRTDSKISDILDSVRKYNGIASDMQEQHFKTETWLVSELTHRFLTDDEHLINLVLDNICISDFEPMIDHIISSENSMGKIGGKGSGIFIANQILQHASKTEPLLSDIKMPRTWFLATDQMTDFLHYNNLEDLNAYKYNTTFHIRMTYDHVVAKMKNAELSPQITNMLRTVLEDMPNTPLIVRSSSLLEDKQSGAFSGKYKSLFIANTGSKQKRLESLTSAILEVYSSMYNPDAIQYRKERGLLNYTEQMGVLIQEVIGTKMGKYFMPLFGGVAFSNNQLRWSSRIEREDGLVRVVMGLGTRAVDRVNNDYPIMFAPGKPQLNINQTTFDVCRYSPKHIDLINLEDGCFTTVDANEFLKEYSGTVPKLDQLISVYEDGFMKTKNMFALNPKQDDMYITFDHILKSTNIPQKIKRMIDVLSEKMQTPVDVELAYDGKHLYLLQCRPQGVGMTNEPAPIPQNLTNKDLLFTANKFISDGKIQDIEYIVYVDVDGYNNLSTREELLAVGEVVGLLNDLLPYKKYILMGPGRWGSRGDIKLGVRVTYSDISNTAALIEIAKEKHSYVPEVSFGTHFFQDLVEANIMYIPLYPGQKDILFREEYFRSSTNILDKLLPDFKWLSDVVKVIAVDSTRKGYSLSIHMNSELEQAVAFFKHKLDTDSADSRKTNTKTPLLLWPKQKLKNEQEHWRWRQYMAQKIADSMDMDVFGVKGVYLFGSTNTGATGIGSDIDLIIHVDGNDKQRESLNQWLSGWSRALARINFLQTGYDTDYMLDVHFVTDKDIASGDSFAIKIHSTTDPASLLKKRD